MVRSLGGGKVRASLGGAEALAQRSGFTSSANPPPAYGTYLFVVQEKANQITVRKEKL